MQLISCSELKNKTVKHKEKHPYHEYTTSNRRIKLENMLDKFHMYRIKALTPTGNINLTQQILHVSYGDNPNCKLNGTN